MRESPSELQFKEAHKMYEGSTRCLPITVLNLNKECNIPYLSKKKKQRKKQIMQQSRFDLNRRLIDSFKSSIIPLSPNCLHKTMRSRIPNEAVFMLIRQPLPTGVDIYHLLWHSMNPNRKYKRAKNQSQTSNVDPQIHNYTCNTN